MREWKILKLPECLDKTPKFTKIPRKQFLDEGRFPIISQEKGLINGYWDDESDRVKVDRPIVIFGDHTQVVKLVDFDFVVGADGVKLFIPRKFLYPKYLYYYLLGHPQKELGYARHYRLLKELDIRFPPLPEQKRIVAILDEAFAGIDAAIANTEKNLANARELFESYLNSVFSLSNVEWQERQLNELVRGDCSLSYGIVQPGNDVEDGLPVVRPTDLTDKVIALSGLKKIDPSLAHAYSRTTLHGNDLLLCVRGSTGTVSIAHEELKGANVTRGIVPIRFDDCLISDGFGYYLMCSPKVQRQIADMTYGAALMQINIRDLRKIVVQVPPLNIQSRIKSQLDDVSHESVRLRSIYQQKLTTLTELKQSLLQKAFTGELTAEKEKDEVKEAVA